MKTPARSKALPLNWRLCRAPEPDTLIRSFRSDLDAQLVRLSFLIRVSFESSDKALAAKVANTLADVYIENDLEARLQMTQRARSWLSGRVKGLRETVEASERALQQFRDREKIVDAKGVALGASSQLTSMTTALVQARQRAAELENAYHQVRAVLKGESRATLESIPAVLRSPSVMPIKAAQAEAERKLAELSSRYGANHPRIIAAESDLRAARENTKKAVDSVVASITREYEVAKATEKTMQLSLDKSKSEIRDMSRKKFQLASLERDVQSNRALYEMFVNRGHLLAYPEIMSEALCFTGLLPIGRIRPIIQP
ncbi:MAG: hypothetical protein ABIH03_17125 [Pseudomonadota bacterium]